MNADPGPSLEAAHLAFARSLGEVLRAKFSLGARARTVIAIAGESGSGKSITATSLARVLTADGRASAVLHQDDYFLRPPRANHEHRCADLATVGPHEVNLAALASHVAAFREGRDDVIASLTDYPSDSFLTRRLDFGAVAVLVVEGTYVFRLDDADIRIFLEATHAETAERRQRRNRDIDAPVIDRILAIEHALIAPQTNAAHIVIDREFEIRAGGATIPTGERAKNG